MKFLARSLGLLLAAAGFIGLVIDGTRSIANDDISFKTIGDLVTALLSGGVPGLQASITQRAIPWLWDPVMVHVLQFPASVTAFVLGALLLWLGQKPLEPIGFLAGR